MFKFASGYSRFSWRGFLLLISVVAVCSGIFLWRLSSLTPGLSAAEKQAALGSRSIHEIASDPVNAPHKWIQFAFHHFEPNSLAWLRLPSVIFALIFCFCFYKLAVSWFGRAIGLFATLIFATLPLLIIGARQATPEIMYFSPVVFMWLYVWLLKNQAAKKLVWSSILLAAGIFIYTPGILILLAITLLLARRRILAVVKTIPLWMSSLGGFWIAVNIGFITAESLKHPAVIKTLCLVPQQNPGVQGVLKNIGWMAASLFVRTANYSPTTLGHLPVMSLLLTAIIVFGVYAMQGVARNKALALILCVIFAVLAAGLNNNLSMLALGVPPLCLFVAAGLRYLYIEWRSIFPRNPVPKTFALALIALVTASQLYYGLHYALIAWPHSRSTQAAYVLK